MHPGYPGNLTDPYGIRLAGQLCTEIKLTFLLRVYTPLYLVKKNKKILQKLHKLEVW